MYNVTVIFQDGHRLTLHYFDAYQLTRALDKCEIKSFTVKREKYRQ